MRALPVLLVSTLVAGTAPAARAQTAEPASAAQAPAPTDPLQSLQLGVTLEGFYEYNWNRPYDRVNVLRAYDARANVFGLQQVALVMDGAPKVDEGRRFGARVDLQFGQATDTVQGNPANEPRPDVYRHLWQAYGTYVFPVGRGLEADFGKFASNLGYETNYAKDDDHFSRGYLFGFLPFYHSGVRLSLPVGDRVTVAYALTNGIQQTEDFNDYKSSHFTVVGEPAATVTWTTSVYVGQEQPDGGAPAGPDGFFRVFDTYVAWAATPALGVGLDVNYVTSEVNSADDALALQGTGAYARYRVSTPAALAVRYERLDDEGLFGGIDQVLHEVTATAEYKFADGFLMRAELRRDWSNQRFFTGLRPGEPRKGQTTALVGLVWWFGNKAGAW
ncbi:MAG: outer membrane beta-barrel protein [Vicinamibacterales bacterium]